MDEVELTKFFNGLAKQLQTDIPKDAIGFMLVVAVDDGITQYVSNLSREGAIDALRETADRLEQRSTTERGPEPEPDDDEELDEYQTAANTISTRVDTYIKQRYAETNETIKPACFYSAYPTVDDIPQDNLDEVAIQGPCILIADKDPYWAGALSQPYQSEILENPTWLELCYHFERCMEATKDYHHVFLEGVHPTDKQIDGIPVYNFSTGS